MWLPSDNVLGVAPVLTVADVRASAAWYRDSLGFEVVVVAEAPGLPAFAIVQRGRAQIHLMAGEPALAYVSIHVADVDAFHAEIAARGALAEGFPRHLDSIREHPPEDKPYGRDMFLENPDGTVLQIRQG